MNTPAPHPSLPVALLACVALATCGYDTPADTPGPAATAAAAMSPETFSAAIQTLSSDEFEGRAPSTPGEETTVAYLVAQFQAAGLEPGNGDSFFQNVPTRRAHGTGTTPARGDGRRHRPRLHLVHRLRGLDQTRRRDRVDHRFRDGLRRLRRGRAGVRLERLRGRRRRRQDRRHPGERPGLCDPGRSALPRQFDDLLRALDLQVRGGGPAGRGGGDRRPRGSCGRIPVGGRERQLDRPAVRPGRERRQHGPGRHRGMGAGARCARDLRGGRTRLRGARAGGHAARLPRRPPWSVSLGGRLQRHPALRVEERDRAPARGANGRTSTSSTRPTGTTSGAATTPWRTRSSTAPSTTPPEPPA